MLKNNKKLMKEKTGKKLTEGVLWLKTCSQRIKRNASCNLVRDCPLLCSDKLWDMETFWLFLHLLTQKHFREKNDLNLMM